MQGPAIGKLLIKVRSGSGPVALDRGGDTTGNRTDRDRRVGLDGMPDERDLLFASDIDRHVTKATLYLEPFVAHFARKPVSVVIESLVQNADDNEPAFAA